MFPTMRIIDCDALLLMRQSAVFCMQYAHAVYVHCMSILHALASTNDATHVYLACLAFGAVGSDM